MNTETTPTEEVFTPVVVGTPNTNTPIQFNVSASAVARMQKETSKLSIAGPDDKDGYKAVNEFRLTVTRQLADVRKKQKALKRPHTDYNRDVDSAANALINPMVAIENTLKLAEKKYNDDVARIAREKELAQQRRTEGRLNQLRAFGFVYNGTDSTYDFIRDEWALHLRINFDDIKELSDDDFEPTMYRAEAIHQTEQKFIAEKKERERIEAERIAEEQRVEREKLAADKQKLADERAEMDRKLKELNDKLKAQARQIREQALATRVSKLLEIGYVEEGDDYVLPGFPGMLKKPLIIADMTDEQFEEFVQAVIKGVQEHKQKQIDDLAAEAQRVKDQEAADLQKKLDDEARVARLAPDKKLLLAYLNKLATMTMPKVTQLESEQFFGEFCNDVDRVINSYKRKLEEL